MLLFFPSSASKLPRPRQIHPVSSPLSLLSTFFFPPSFLINSGAIIHRLYNFSSLPSFLHGTGGKSKTPPNEFSPRVGEKKNSLGRRVSRFRGGLWRRTGETRTHKTRLSSSSSFSSFPIYLSRKCVTVTAGGEGGGRNTKNTCQLKRY